MRTFVAAVILITAAVLIDAQRGQGPPAAPPINHDPRGFWGDDQFDMTKRR